VQVRVLVVGPVAVVMVALPSTRPSGRNGIRYRQGR
jgi:hypothetical protein